MPSTLSGVLVFLALLAPGITYSAARAEFRPERERSVLRETGTTVLMSVGCIAAVLAAATLLRAFVPEATPNVGRLVRGSTAYQLRHYRELLWWGFGLLTSACALAVLLAWLLPDHPLTHKNSAWFRAFDIEPKEYAKKGHKLKPVYVGAELVDGAYYGGWLRTYSHATDDLADRDVFLSGPIKYRARPDVAERTLKDVSGVVVSARQMRGLCVSYVPVEDEASVER